MARILETHDWRTFTWPHMVATALLSSALTMLVMWPQAPDISAVVEVRHGVRAPTVFQETQQTIAPSKAASMTTLPNVPLLLQKSKAGNDASAPTEAAAHLPPLPPHGMAALQTNGAWDGKIDGEQVVEASRAKVECVITDIMPTEALVALFPPTGAADPCLYRRTVMNRGDVSPTHYFYTLTSAQVDSIDARVGRDEVLRHIENPKWQVADFERLARLSSDAYLPYTSVYLYLALVKKGSTQASVFASRYDFGFERRELDKLISKEASCEELMSASYWESLCE